MIKIHFLFLFTIWHHVSVAQQLKVSTDFESGSARVLSIDQQTQTIRFTPAGAENPSLFHRVSVPWVLEHSNVNTIAFCIETPWNTPDANPEGYSVVGQKLGSVVTKHLREETPQP